MRRRCARKRRESRAPAERGKNARRQCPFRPGKPRLRHVVDRPCHVLTPGATPILNSARIAVHRLGSLLPAWPGQLPAPPIHSAEDVEDMQGKGPCRRGAMDRHCAAAAAFVMALNECIEALMPCSGPSCATPTSRPCAASVHMRTTRRRSAAAPRRVTDPAIAMGNGAADGVHAAATRPAALYSSCGRIILSSACGRLVVFRHVPVTSIPYPSLQCHPFILILCAMRYH